MGSLREVWGLRPQLGVLTLHSVLSLVAKLYQVVRSAEFSPHYKL